MPEPELNPKKAALKGNAAQLAKILGTSVGAKQGDDMPESNPLQPGQKVGARRFTLVKPLGRGGMGVVWLAHDTHLDESVALKFLPPEIASNPAAVNDLRRETVRSHKLTHPNIIRIHDFQQDNEGAFISMEYVDGVTLSDRRLQQTLQVLTWEQLAPLVEQLCAALEYAHEEKVIHRDLKPANMMVDSKGRLKLADFGIAAVASDSMSKVSVKHSTSGTPPYMSPQQMSGNRPQVTDDIYALGATLYELLTSQPPFHSGDIIHQVLHIAPEPMHERLEALGIENEIPAAVSAMVMSCLAKEPAQRPQSAGAIAGWIGLEVAHKPSLKHLGKEVFSEALPAMGPSGTLKIGAAAPAASSSRKKPLWAVGVFVALLLLAVGGWYFVNHKPIESLIPAVPPEPAAAAANTTPVEAPIVKTTTTPAPPAAEPIPKETWTFTTIAGQAGSGGSTDGIRSDARLEEPSGIALDEEGNIYVSEFKNTIRLIKPSGLVSTLAGLAGKGGSSDGVGTNARFSLPLRIATALNGNLYVTDNGNHTIRMITGSGMVTTLAGQAGSIGSADGPAAIARFNAPTGIAVGSGGIIFVADGNNHTIRKITPDGLVHTLAGRTGIRGSVDGSGSRARFNGPNSLAVGARGILYVTDKGNDTIRAINSNGVVSTLAGHPGSAGSADGMKGDARFRDPRGIAVDGEGNLYVADTFNNTIRKVTIAGAVTTIAGLAGSSGSADGMGKDARFYDPMCIALDKQGNIYVSDFHNHTIRMGRRNSPQSSANPVTANSSAANPNPLAASASTHAETFTLSQADLLALDCNYDAYYLRPPSVVTVTGKRAVAGQGVEFDIWFPGNNSATNTSIIWCSTIGHGNGSLTKNDISQYDGFALDFTLLSVNGSAQSGVGGPLTVGAIINQANGAYSYRPEVIGFEPSEPGAHALSITKTSARIISTVGFTVNIPYWWYTNHLSNPWSANGSHVTLLVKPASDAKPLHPPPGKPQTVFGNFGAGYSYIQKDGWTIYKNVNGTTEEAVSFIPTVDFYLSNLKLAIENEGGENNALDVSLMALSPTNSALETFHFSGAMHADDGLTHPPLVANSVLRPKLNARTSYWITASQNSNASSSYALWKRNSIGMTGLAAGKTTDPKGISSGWHPGVFSNPGPGAFEVNGILTPPVAP